MTLATRCTACGTVFRVVQDQLRVSEGWVRCGRCSEVFNAVENLVEAPLQAGPPVASTTPGALPFLPAPMSPPASPPMRDEAAAADAAPDPAPTAGDRIEPRFGDDADIVIDPDDRLPHRAASPAGTAASDAGASAQATDVGNVGNVGNVASAAADTPAAAAEPAPPSPADGTGSEALPSFLRRADRAARWRRPRVRAALAALALLGAAGLAAQAAHTWRDLLAARHPATAPLLAAACQALGCTVSPPRQIDALVVDSSGLLRVERSALYRLSVGLRNRETHAIAVPAVDLTLTDTQGRVIARRVLQPADLGAAPDATVAGGRDLLLQATLQARGDSPGQLVAGYTIELFYP